MQSLTEIKALLAARGLRPRHRFGQNFLHDQNLIRRLVDAADVQGGDLVLEVGPGTGTLTEALLERSAHIIAIEIDRDLSQLLRDRFGESITLIEGDCLASKHRISPALLEALGDKPFKLVANLPYNIASPLMINLLLEVPSCGLMCVTIQKEVADRLLAAPSTKDYGPLTIVAQSFARIERLTNVPPACFWPRPDVTSAMVRLTRREPGDIPIDDPAAFGRFVTSLFTKRRKQLGTIFGRDHDLPKDIDPEARPESLTIDQVARLYQSVAH